MLASSRTSSSAKIGTSIRTASAIASEGLALMTCLPPLVDIVISAKKVPSTRSLIRTCSTLTSRSSRTFLNVLDDLDVSVEQVLINDLVDGTFFAEITMSTNGGKHVISARPSDAIALAVRMEVPIFAEEEVLDEASIVMETADEDEIQRFRDFLDHVEPQDFL